MGLAGVTGMTYEMGMNKMIKPSLAKFFSKQKVTINMQNLFVFLMSPEGSEDSMILHIPDMSLLNGKEFKDKNDVISTELPQFFEREEYTNKVFEEMRVNNTERMIPVTQLAVGINGVSMDLVNNKKLKSYIVSKVMNSTDNNNTNLNNSVVEEDNIITLQRNIMAPTFIAYNIRNYGFSDPFNEINFSRGVANIGAVEMKMNIHDLDYLQAWQTQTGNLESLNSLKVTGSLDKELKEIIERKRKQKTVPINRVNKKNLDIVFQGLNLDLMDDIFLSNLPYLNFKVLPILTNQVDNSTTNGLKGINIGLEGSYYNYNCNEWEPILENFSLVLDSYKDNKGKSFMNISFAD